MIFVFFVVQLASNKDTNTNKIVIALGPHHLLAEELILLPFEQLKTKSFNGTIPKKFDEIFIIGPNHFHLGGHPALTASHQNLRFKGFKLSSFAKQLAASRLVNETDEVFQNEHSIYTYLPLIRDNYPSAKITPLALASEFPEKLVPELADDIVSLAQHKNQNVLIIFSVDFSHYQNRKVARLHDIKTQGVLDMLEKSEAYNLEVDCRACISLMLELAQKLKLNPLETNDERRLVNKTSFDYLGYESPEGQTTYFSGVLTKQGNSLKKRPVTVLAFGDLLLDRSIKTLIEEKGADFVLEKLGGKENRFFEGIDFIFANLETAVVQEKVQSGKEVTFQSNPKFLNILLKHKINLVSIANNHAYDAGRNGFYETVEHLKEYGITGVGDPKQVSELSSFQTEKGGYKIAFVAFNNTDFKLQIQEALSLLKEVRLQNDFVIVSIHWGVEYSHLPSTFQKELAAQIVESGADVIIGHHPHVIQGMEFINGRPVFYSLGNFIFDQWFSDATQEGMAVGISLKKPAIYNDQGISVQGPDIDLYLIPLQIEKGVPFQPATERASAVLEKFYKYSLKTNPEIENYHSVFE